MNRTDHDDKIQEMLSTSTYKKLEKDPTASTERKVTKHLRKNDSPAAIGADILTISRGNSILVLSCSFKVSKYISTCRPGWNYL